MLQLVVGIILFLVPHSIRIVVPAMRERLLARVGEPAYKGAYSLFSLAGLVLLSRGYGEIRTQSPLLWAAPDGLRHLSLILVPVAIALVAAAYTPPGRIKRAVGHPMVAGVGLWAFAHLLANGRTADFVLFGAFLVWAVADYAAALRRDPRPVRGAVSGRGDFAAVGIAAAASAALLAGGHLWLFGVAPIS